MTFKVLCAVLIISLAYVSEAVFFRDRFPGKTLADLAECKDKHAVTGYDLVIPSKNKYGTKHGVACAKYCLKQKLAGERKDIEKLKNIVASAFSHTRECYCLSGGTAKYTPTTLQTTGCIFKAAAPATCEPAITTLKKGTVKCSDGNKEGSTCELTCDQGYTCGEYEPHVHEVTCKNGAWSETPVEECIPKECPISYLENLEKSEGMESVTCSGGIEGMRNSWKANCKFKCADGYLPSRTDLSDSCRIRLDGAIKEGWWYYGNDPVKCIKQATPATCEPAITTLINGKVECTDSNNEGSTCTLTCDDGYTCGDATLHVHESTCTNGQWDSKPVEECIPISCPAESLELTDGVESVNCENGKSGKDTDWLSRCTFTCKDGYSFENEKKQMIRCVGDGDHSDGFGRWYGDVPKCIKEKKPEWPCIANDPCQNGAKCINVGKADGSRGYECECKVGFEGTDCDQVKASPGQWCIDALKSSSIPNKNKADFDKVAWNDGYVYFYTNKGYEFRDAENRCEEDYGELAWAGMDSLETREKIITALGQDDQQWGTAWFGLTLENGKWQYGNDFSDQFHWDSWSIKGADMTPGNVGTLTIHKGKDDNLKSSYWGRENAAYNNALCQISCSFFED